MNDWKMGWQTFPGYIERAGNHCVTGLALSIREGNPLVEYSSFRRHTSEKHRNAAQKPIPR
jgi:hypothetical protein